MKTMPLPRDDDGKRAYADVGTHAIDAEMLDSEDVHFHDKKCEFFLITSTGHKDPRTFL